MSRSGSDFGRGPGRGPGSGPAGAAGMLAPLGVIGEVAGQETLDGALDGALVPALYVPPLRASGAHVGELRGTLVEVVKALGDVEWGGAPGGNLAGMTVRIERSELWTHPCISRGLSAGDPAYVEMAGSLRVHGQLQPLVVTPARDPRPSADGGTGASYLVLDGEIRMRAAALSGRVDLHALECKVRVHRDAFAAAMDALGMKASARALTDEQMGAWLRRIRALYEAVRLSSSREAVSPWPKQEEWARLLGRSQATVSRWLAVARAHPAVVEAVESGVLRESAAAELTALRRADQVQVLRELQAGLPAGQQAGQAVVVEQEPARSGAVGTVPTTRPTTIPRAQVRAAVRARQVGPTQWIDHAQGAVPTEALLLKGLGDDPAVAFGVLAHDLSLVLAAALDAMAAPDGDLARLLKALQQPKIAAFAASVAASVAQPVAEPVGAPDPPGQRGR